MRAIAFIILVFLAGSAFGQQLSACPEKGTSYLVRLADPSAHLIHIEATFRAAGGKQRIQLPVWNALYQVRDFSQYMLHAHGNASEGYPLAIEQIDKSTWSLQTSADCATFAYDYVADIPGPFGIQYNDHHAFLNWAMVLIYHEGKTGEPVTIQFAGVPKSWRLRDAGILGSRDAGLVNGWSGTAESYNALIDSPVEIGSFTQVDFASNGANFHVVVDGEPSSYNTDQITSALKKIADAAIDWMQDRPFRDYTFIYHFPHGQAGGGMEHANGTAIDVSADRLKTNPMAYASVSAHEFFHLWNVKRIRPQSLEPIDYMRENYSRALWFSEGVTSTVSDHLLVRAGLIDSGEFLRRVAGEIGELESRPAKNYQSAEQSSLETWYDKYPFYASPERSISYYNKGYLLGVLLDLKLRNESRGKICLRDLFQYMDNKWAKQGKFFDDSESVRAAAEAITGDDFKGFFSSYVSGTVPLPYDEMFRSVGLRLRHRSRAVTAAGFTASRVFGAALEINSVEPNSEAAKGGVVVGDIVMSVNALPVTGDFGRFIRSMKPGDVVQLRLRGRRGAEREIKLRLGTSLVEEYNLENMPGATPEMLSRRDAWIHGEAERRN